MEEYVLIVVQVDLVCVSILIVLDKLHILIILNKYFLYLFLNNLENIQKIITEQELS